MENLQGGMLALEHRYAVDAEVGRQGLATLYRGTQHPFERSVMLYAYDMFEQAADASVLVESIKSGAQRASVLDHDGVLRIVDYGELTSEIPFVVVERSTGPTLGAFLEQSGTLSLEDVVALVERLAEIIDEAHIRGVVHGSLSPHVVSLPQKDVHRACVGGFCLNAPLEEVRKIDGAMLDFPLVAGMAPELFKDASKPTRSCDIFALGAIAYMALSGQHPFFEDVNDTSDGLLKIQSGTARSLTDFGFSEAIWQALEPTLNRDPDARPEAAQEVAEALRDAAFPKAIESLPEPVVVEENDKLTDGNEADTAAPTPGAVAWGALLLALVLTNIGWFTWVGEVSVSEQPVDPPVSPTVLAPGVEIDTSPSGAKVFLEGETLSELGESPMVIDPKIGANGRATLRLEKRGFVPVAVDVVPASVGNRLVIKLTEQVK